LKKNAFADDGIGDFQWELETMFFWAPLGIPEEKMRERHANLE
jgi:hypothetical protein